MIEAILNRLRGTGLIKSFGTFTLFSKTFELKLVWNHIYAIYLALLLGVVFSSIYLGLSVLILYFIGESKGWGEWVGALTRWEVKDEQWLLHQYTDTEGKKFPFIHQIANWITPEVTQGTIEERLKMYLRYAKVALSLRGMFWWGCVYLPIMLFGYIGLMEYLIMTILLGLSFPLACYIGKNILYNKRIWIVNFSRGWENQEIVYGLFQGIALWYLVLSNL